VVFWALTSYRLIGGYPCFRGTYCLHLQDKSDWGMYVVDYIVKRQCMSVGGRGGKEVHKDVSTGMVLTKCDDKITALF